MAEKKKEPSPHDVQIGKNLVVLRGDMSQMELANKMRKIKGHPWSQTTVWTVEKGERPLRLTEARDLGELLNFELDELLGTRQKNSYISEAEKNLRVLASKRLAAASAIADLVEARSEFWRITGDTTEEAQGRYEAQASLLDSYNKTTIWEAILEAHKIYSFDTVQALNQVGLTSQELKRDPVQWSGVKPDSQPLNVPPVPSPLEELEAVDSIIQNDTTGV